MPIRPFKKYIVSFQEMKLINQCCVSFNFFTGKVESPLHFCPLPKTRKVFAQVEIPRSVHIERGLRESQPSRLFRSLSGVSFFIWILCKHIPMFDPLGEDRAGEILGNSGVGGGKIHRRWMDAIISFLFSLLLPHNAFYDMGGSTHGRRLFSRGGEECLNNL